MIIAILETFYKNFRVTHRKRKNKNIDKKYTQNNLTKSELEELKTLGNPVIIQGRYSKYCCDCCCDC